MQHAREIHLWCTPACAVALPVRRRSTIHHPTHIGSRSGMHSRLVGPSASLRCRKRLERAYTPALAVGLALTLALVRPIELLLLRRLVR